MFSSPPPLPSGGEEAKTNTEMAASLLNLTADRWTQAAQLLGLNDPNK